MLLRQNEGGIHRKIAGFEMVERGIPRSHYDVISGDKKIGFVTTGSYSPSLEKNIGLALVDIGHSEPGTEFYVVIRNRQLKAKVINIPFYSRKHKKTL